MRFRGNKNNKDFNIRHKDVGLKSEYIKYLLLAHLLKYLIIKYKFPWRKFTYNNT